LKNEWVEIQRSSPSSPSNAWWNGCRGAGPCQALAAEGGGRKARLYKGHSPPATIATSGRRAAVRGHASRAQRLGGHRVTHSKFNRAVFVYKLIAADTVEERIIELQDKKGRLAAATLDAGAAVGSLVVEDLDYLFRE
jgi:hypothetical protein